MHRGTCSMWYILGCMFTYISTYMTNLLASPKKIVTGVFVALGALVGLVLVLALLMFVLRVVTSMMPGSLAQSMSGSSYAERAVYGSGANGMATNYVAEDVAYDMAVPQMGYGSISAKVMSAPSSIGMPVLPPMPTVNGSRNAEKYERTGYSASYETRHLDEVCDAVEALKPLSYVLFDNANRGKRQCSYSFRVEGAKSDAVVATLKALDPKEFTVSIDTMAQQIENTEDQKEALTRRIASVESTLKEAEVAYARLTTLATQNGKVSDLTEIITQKLAMVERLTNERMNLEEQLRQLANTKTQQVDETAYTHISVYAQKRTVVDWQNIRDAWRASLAHMVYSVSGTLSDILFGLPLLIVWVLWVALFGGVSILALVVFVKYAWLWAQKVWKM